MSVLVDKNTKVITQGMTGKTGSFHTQMCRAYGFGQQAFVAGVNPKKAGTTWEGLPIFGTVAEAKEATGADVSVIYVPPAGAAQAIIEASDAGMPVDYMHYGRDPHFGHGSGKGSHEKDQIQVFATRPELSRHSHSG